MYAVKPVLTRFENIELPSSMYRIKPHQDFCPATGAAGDDFLDRLSKQVDMIVQKVN